MRHTEWLTLGIEKVRTYEGPDGRVVPYDHPTRYEVRYAPDPSVPWVLARKAGESHCGTLRTQDFCYGTQYYQVRGRSLWSNDFVTTVNTPVAITNPVPGDHTDQAVRDEQDEGSPPGWPGTITGGVTGDNIDTNLALVATGGTGVLIYESDEFDMGALGRWHLAVCPWVKYDNHHDTWVATDPTDFWTDDEDWTTGEVDELGEPIPDEFGWDDSWNEDIGEDWIGDIDDPPVTYIVESSVHESQGGGVMEEHRPGVFYGRYAQVRITITGSAIGADDHVIDSIDNSMGGPIEIVVSSASPGHGLVTGNSVSIYGVEGIPEANGTFMVTVSDSLTFTLDGTEGTGSSHTGGGTVITGEVLELARLVTRYSRMPFGGPSQPRGVDIRDYGAIEISQPGGTTFDNTTAIDAAQAAVASGFRAGGLVEVPAGTWNVNTQVKVQPWTVLRGAGPQATVIAANASLFPTSTPVVRLGLGTGSAFSTRLEDMAIACNDIVGSTGIYSNEIEEWGGCFRVQVVDPRAWGFHFEGPASEFTCTELGFDGSNATALSGGGIWFEGTNGHVSVDVMSFSGIVASPTTGVGVSVTNCGVSINDSHFERFVTAIKYGAGASGSSLSNVYGHETLDTLVEVNAVGSYTFENLIANSATNTLVDNVRSVTYTSASYAIIPFWSYEGIQLGSVKVLVGAQTSTQQATATVPDMAGSNADFVLSGVGANVITQAQLPNPIGSIRLGATAGAGEGLRIRKDGSTIAQEPRFESENQLATENVLRIPSLTADSTSLTRDVIVSQLGSGVFQECRSLITVDVQIKRESQTGNLVTLNSADQTGAGTAQIPDLGDADGHFIMLNDVQATVTNKTLQDCIYEADSTDEFITFQASDGSTQAVLDLSAITGDEEFILPNVVGSDTLAVLGAAQTLSAKTLDGNPVLVNPRMGPDINFTPDLSRIAKFNLEAGWTASTTHTYIVPDLGSSPLTTTMVVTDFAQTLEEKTLDRPQFSSGSVEPTGSPNTTGAIPGTITSITTTNSPPNQTINFLTGGKAGELLIIKPASGVTLTIADETDNDADGNFRNAGGADSQLSNQEIGFYLGVTNTGGVEWHEFGVA